MFVVLEVAVVESEVLDFVSRLKEEALRPDQETVMIDDCRLDSSDSHLIVNDILEVVKKEVATTAEASDKGKACLDHPSKVL